MLRKPLRFKVKNGRALLDTVSSEDEAELERFKKLITMDDITILEDGKLKV